MKWQPSYSIYSEASGTISFFITQVVSCLTQSVIFLSFSISLLSDVTYGMVEDAFETESTTTFPEVDSCFRLLSQFWS